MGKNKLELTWVGKYDDEKIEPRILIENKEKSYGAHNTDNILIHGDNLLALKSLIPRYAGKIKCVYIDPPFNTGARIDADGNNIGYDDGIEHSIWLNLMYQRLKLIYELLSDNGGIFVHLDDNESDYCKIIMDEIFGRNNFMNRITIDSRSPSAFSTINPGVFKAGEYILFYAKKRTNLIENTIRVERTPDYAYDKFIINFEEDYTNWKFINVNEAFEKYKQNDKCKPSEITNLYNKFIVQNAYRIFRYTSISDSGAGKIILDLKQKSKAEPNKIFYLKRNNYDDVYVLNGQQISFYEKNIKELDGKRVATKLLTDVWTDIAWEGIAKEGNVTFKKGKKPEKLIKRCLELITNEGDLVLDSFLGSGTTAAVAHKMNRKWIGIEMGDHIYSHCIPRLNSIIDGKDNSGISKSVNWNGGGGYKFYELAPTFIKEDSFGEPVINKDYNPEMLARAVALHEGFEYNPDKEVFWKQSKGNENSYLYVTTRFIDYSILYSIYNLMTENEYLIIACTSFDENILNKHKNITIKKIPETLLKKCKYNVDNYNLNVIIEDDVEEENNENE